MKISKFQTPWSPIEQRSDNTRMTVQTPIKPIQLIAEQMRDLKVAELNSNDKQAQLKQGYKQTEFEKKKSDQNLAYHQSLENQIIDNRQNQKALEVVGEGLDLLSPSKYINMYLNSQGKQELGTGERMITDLGLTLGTGALLKGAGVGIKSGLNVAKQYKNFGTFNTKIKPNYQGDWLELYKNRLQNGGFDKLGIVDDQIVVPNLKFKNGTTSDNFQTITREFGMRNSANTINKSEWKTIPRRSNDVNYTVLNSNDVIPKPSYNLYTDKIMIRKDINVPLPDKKTLNQQLAHEYGHRVGYSKNRTTNDYYMSNGQGRVSNMFADLNINDVTLDAPGTNKNKLVIPKNTPKNQIEKVTVDLIDRYTIHDADEMKRMTEQLRNYYGFTKSKWKLTPKMYEYAKKNYRNDMGWNNLDNYFTIIEKPKKFLQWANPRTN